MRRMIPLSLQIALFGKWHLGQTPEHHPLAQGFDESIVSMGKHFNFPTSPKTDYPEGAYLADFLTDKSVDFIRRHKDQPFLLCLHHLGVHSPFQAKQPLIDRFKDKPAAGETCGVPINSVDLYPTLLDLARAKPEPNYPLDGQSYATFLLGTDGAPRRPLYWHFPGYLGSANNTWRTTPAGAIRQGEWKLIEFFEDGRLELYNLNADIGEKNNLAAAQPDKVKELHAKLQAWRKSVNAPMPAPASSSPRQPRASGRKPE